MSKWPVDLWKRNETALRRELWRRDAGWSAIAAQELAEPATAIQSSRWSSSKNS